MTSWDAAQRAHAKSQNKSFSLVYVAPLAPAQRVSSKCPLDGPHSLWRRIGCLSVAGVLLLGDTISVSGFDSECCSQRDTLRLDNMRLEGKPLGRILGPAFKPLLWIRLAQTFSHDLARLSHYAPTATPHFPLFSL